MYSLDVSPRDIKDYAVSLGWSLVQEAIKDGLFVLNDPENEGTQLIFPNDIRSDLYLQSALTAINRLAEIYKIPDNKIFEEIREINDDILCIRYYAEDNSRNINSLQFENLIQIVEGTKNLILSAASTIVNPVLHHPKLNRTEPKELIKKVKFKHTQEGSFVLKISCPLDSFSYVTDLFGNHVSMPYVRQTFSLINEIAYKLHNQIEAGSEGNFIEDQQNSSKPILSYNFCNALSELYDENREIPFELNFDWSKKNKSLLPPPALPRKINYPFKEVLDDIKIFLRDEPQTIDDSFIATVESLNGDITRNGQRAGEVRINILRGDEIIRAKINLDEEKYSIADAAHMHPGRYIRVKGTLFPGIQIRTLDHISEFQLL